MGPMTAALGPSGALWFALGVAGAVVGVLFLVTSSLVAFIGGSAACSTGTLCTSAPVLRAILIISGAALIILGILVAARAVRRGAFQSPWMQLPP